MTSYSNVQKQQLSQLGAYLQEKRQEQGRSLEDISLQTYIRAQLLKSLEAGDTTDLPQPIFVQGFIRRYADALGLDGANFAKQFPVHSIPNTPRPVPRPATQVDMSYQTAAQKPPVQSKPVKTQAKQPQIKQPEIKQPKPAVGAMPLVNEPSVSKAMDSSGSTAEKTTKSTTTTQDFTLDPHPMTDGELTALGLNTLANSADRASSPEGSFLGKEETVPSSLNPAPVTPSPLPMGSRSTNTSELSSFNWRPWAIGAAVVASAIALLVPIILSSGFGKKTDPVEAEAPQSEQVEASRTEPIAPTPAPEPEPEPIAVASDAPVSVTVEVTEAGPSWMSVTVDGAIVFEGTMEPGSKQNWEGEETITMNIGNAGAALISANGSEQKPAGNPGGAEFLTFEAAE
ncbi:helix-turn-helix domain-containing protein [Leptothoe spongobia]|uniref:Helix-turn-helix domain-containing protein n=1 Tax=Leptothoe spongobia TAU-MAC 1115 TaxID=1967444 RepID=A0A947GKR2_9CYAN|nr:helix-turn-helix domain-containing protein [Leptothoe spongobia]MBT9317113.1 helix-turn-helix domain-containing protein [Leptothoe spongobia TAU-MAC 1115]